MDALTSSLVLTKLRVPAARPRLVSRAHLLEQLSPEAGTRLILVCAPAGYGKTTLMAEWAGSLQQNGTAAAWYALDTSDDDPIPFGSYLIASLIQALGPIPELTRTAQLLRSSPQLDLQRSLPAVINAVISRGRDCVLILDDYHLISSPAIHSAVAYLLEHLPANLRIVIGSRSDPPLPLARLRAQGKLLEIRTAHLRFTPDETALFLNEIMRLDLSLEGITTLEQRTEGWVAGLQLAALSLAGRADKERFIASFTGTHRYLVEYLLEEVVNRQTEEVRSFLLFTSILERMCAPLCDAILRETSQSEAILAQLEQSNLFVVALDDQGVWFRYHHLFRDFLQNRLTRTQPERIPHLHRAASDWYEKHGFLREAVQHALQTRDWEDAAALVEQHGFTMILYSEIATLYEWCSAFPEEVMQAHPLLCIHQCWAWVFSFRRQNRARVEARLQLAEQGIAALKDRQLVSELSESAAIVRIFLSMAPDPAADAQAQLVLAQRMLGAYPEGDPGQFSALLTSGYASMALHNAHSAAKALEAARQAAQRGRLYFGVVESTFHLARLTHSQGRLRRAAEICRQGQADIANLLSHPGQELPALGCLDIALGCVLLEQDQLEAAEQRLRRGLDQMGGGMNPYYLMTAYLALFRLYEILRRPAEAVVYLDRLEAAWPDIAFCTDGLRVVHALRTMPEDPAVYSQASAWCQNYLPAEGVPPPGMGPFGAAEVYYLANLAWVRAQIAAGSLPAAQSTLQRQLDLALAHGLADRVIELSLLEAQAAAAQGDPPRTWVALERALTVAQPEGYMRVFDQGPALNRLLIEAAQRGICGDYIKRILAAFQVPKTVDAGDKRAAARVSQELVEPLSDRELEVLRLMAQGAANQAIAEQLVITVGTVKSHINHILGKLEVHNRTEAVARARSLGLLEI